MFQQLCSSGRRVPGEWVLSQNPPHRSAKAGKSDLGAMAPVSKLLHSGLKRNKDAAGCPGWRSQVLQAWISLVEKVSASTGSTAMSD